MKHSLTKLAEHWMAIPADKMVNSRVYFEAQKMFILNAHELGYTMQEIRQFANYRHVSPIICAINTILDWLEIDSDLRFRYHNNKLK